MSEQKPKRWAPALFPKQLQIFNCYKRFLLASGPRRSGKCVDGSTIVRTNSGLSRLVDIGKPTQPGHTSRLKCSLKSFKDGSFEDDLATIFHRDACTDGFKVVTDWGYTISTSGWHPLWCCIDGVFSYKTASELRDLVTAGVSVYLPLIKGHDWEGDLKTVTYRSTYLRADQLERTHGRIRSAIASLPPDSSWNKIARTAFTHYRAVKSFFEGRVRQDLHTTITEDVGYLLGLLVGDGCISKSHNPNIVLGFSSNDSEIIESMKSILEVHFGATIRHSSRCDWNIVECNKLRSLLTHLGMNKLAHEKTFPRIILESPKSVIKAFLQGLFDTDGTVDKLGRVSFCSSSESLAKDVHQLLLSFEVSSFIKFKKNDGRGAWHVSVYGDSQRFFNSVGFRLQRKQHRSKYLPSNNLGSHICFPPCIQKRLRYLYSNKTVKMSRKEWRTGLNRRWAEYASGKYQISADRIAKFMAFLSIDKDPVIDQYLIEGKAFWRKIESINECKVDLYDLSVRKNHSFVGNGFINHNTIGVVHRVVRHLWETPNAVVGVFSKILRTAKDTGVWQDFLTIVLPEWMGKEVDEEGNETYVPKVFGRSGLPFEFTTFDSKGEAGPKSDSVTRSMYFKIRNYWGGESKLLLFSLDNENEAQARLKQTRFSMIYVPELSEFKTDVIYKIGSQQLRAPGMPSSCYQWIADTNPSEEGEESWIYDLFYRQRLAEKHPQPLVHKELGLIEVFLEDNPTITDFDRESLEQAYSADQGEYERNINGLWVKGHGKIGRVFADIFDNARHIVPDYIDIDIGGSVFIGGWDIGNTNSAAVMMEKRTVVKDGVETTVWIVFDELVFINTPISTEEFVIQFCTKIEEWERLYGKKLIFETHYSDDDAVNKFRANNSLYDYMVVLNASEGAIELTGVSKPAGSIGARVRMMRRLLQENRFFVGSNCVQTIEMFNSMMKGNNEPISKGSQHKHVFDAISYGMMATCLDEMDYNSRPNTRESRIISI